MAYKDNMSEWWGWGQGGGEAERGAVGGVPNSPPRDLPPHVSHGELAAENRRLYLDNMRLWDCLALFRTDPSLTCQGAINTIFSLDDKEYLREFPDTQNLLNTRFPGGLARHRGELDAASENNRLKEENTRLHAAVWVLRDNSTLHADSTVAAIFRLSDEQFQKKFGVVNQVTAGLCYRNSFERSSRNNNKVKVRAMRTHLDLGARTNTIHLIKKPLGPWRSSRPKSASGNRQMTPVGENSITTLALARKRSESAEPLQNFSSNRKLATAEEVRDFVYGHSYHNPPLGFEEPPPLTQNIKKTDRRHVQSTRKPKSKEQNGALSSRSDTNQACTTHLNSNKKHSSRRQTAKPIKCVSFEEPLPTTHDESQEIYPRETYEDKIVCATSSVGSMCFKDRLQSILNAPTEQRSHNIGENIHDMASNIGEAVKFHGEKGRTSSKKTKDRPMYSTYSPSSTLATRDAMSGRGDINRPKGNAQRSDSCYDLRGSNSNRMGSKCPADEDYTHDDDEEEEEEGQRGESKGNYEGLVHFRSEKCKRPRKPRRKYILQEPSKRHKEEIRHSPVLDPRTSLHRLHISAGDGSIPDMETIYRTRSEIENLPLDRNFNRSLEKRTPAISKDDKNGQSVSFSDRSAASCSETEVESSENGKIHQLGCPRCKQSEEEVSAQKSKRKSGEEVSAQKSKHKSEEEVYAQKSKHKSEEEVSAQKSKHKSEEEVSAQKSKHKLPALKISHVRRNRSFNSSVVEGTVRSINPRRQSPIVSCASSNHKNGVIVESEDFERHLHKKTFPEYFKNEYRPFPHHERSTFGLSKTVQLDGKTDNFINLFEMKPNLKKNLRFQSHIKIEDAISSRADETESQGEIYTPTWKTGPESTTNKTRVNKEEPSRGFDMTSNASRSLKDLKDVSDTSKLRMSNPQLLNTLKSRLGKFSKPELELKLEDDKFIHFIENIPKTAQTKFDPKFEGRTTFLPARNLSRPKPSPSIMATKESRFVNRSLAGPRFSSFTKPQNAAEDGNKINMEKLKIQRGGVTQHREDRTDAVKNETCGIASCHVPQQQNEGQHRMWRRFSQSGGDLGKSSSETDKVSFSSAVTPYDIHLKMRPKSAIGPREFSTVRQANLRHPSEILKKSDQADLGEQPLQAQRPKAHKKKVSDSAGSSGASTIYYTSSSCRHILPRGRSYSTTSGVSYPEEFQAQPTVYLSTEPAPNRASRYNPYPHHTYVTVKQFTDRHQRIMPQPAPLMRRLTSTMFSFSREKSASMALLLDDDYQRWLAARVRTGQQSTLKMAVEQPNQRRKSHVYRRNLERWPSVKPPDNSIYSVADKLIPSQSSAKAQVQGALKDCNKVTSCRSKHETHLAMLKELGGVKYRGALATMLKRNIQAANKSPCSLKANKNQRGNRVKSKEPRTEDKLCWLMN